MDNQGEKACIFCNKNNSQIPLVQLSYMDKSYWICPQHIPILIHDPSKLAGKLPGAEDMQAG